MPRAVERWGGMLFVLLGSFPLVPFRWVPLRPRRWFPFLARSSVIKIPGRRTRLGGGFVRKPQDVKMREITAGHENEWDWDPSRTTAVSHRIDQVYESQDGMHARHCSAPTRGLRGWVGWRERPCTALYGLLYCTWALQFPVRHYLPRRVGTDDLIRDPSLR